jgi:hypothetical protein
MKPKLAAVLHKRGIALLFTLALLPSLKVLAAGDTCTKHGPAASGCSFCLDGHVREGEGTVVTFRWTNPSSADFVIRKSGNVKLEMSPGQPGAKVGSTSDFGGSVVDSVSWMPLDGGSEFVALVFEGTQSDLLRTRGTFMLSSVLPGFDAALPAIVLKVSVELAEYDFKTHQRGPFRNSTQCAVFYKTNL